MADRPMRRWLTRSAMTAAHRLLRICWFFTRPRTFGVRAIVVTPAREVVLLRHSYLRGWYLPGGGRKPGEDAEAAMIRELREEIGLVGFDAIRATGFYEHRPHFKRDHVDLFLVEGARYRWLPSAEIDEVRAFDPRELPGEISDRSRIEIARWLGFAAPSRDISD